MNASNIINALQKFPPDTHVLIDNDEDVYEIDNQFDFGIDLKPDGSAENVTLHFHLHV